MRREENLHWIDEEIRTWESECQSKHPIKEALYAAHKALEQEPKIDRLYSYLNDMRFGIAPDETTPTDERDKRLAQIEIIDGIMEWIEKESEE